MGRKKAAEELYRFGVSMEQSLIKKFDSLLMKRGYYNRSEAIRDLVRDQLAKEKIDLKNDVVYGIVSFIYNHQHHELENKITHFQHENYKSIFSTTHIHIDSENCLEVIIIKDRAKKIKAFAGEIFALKGVLNGQISFISLV